MKAASGGADVAVLPSRGGELSTYKQMLKTNVALILIATANMNHNIVKLAVEHDVNKATALCQEIRIDALHLAAMQKDIAGERAKSDALLKRAHMIKLSNEANERIMQLRLNRLSLLAKNYTQAFQALGNPAAVAVPAI